MAIPVVIDATRSVADSVRLFHTRRINIILHCHTFPSFFVFFLGARGTSSPNSVMHASFLLMFCSLRHSYTERPLGFSGPKIGVWTEACHQGRIGAWLAIGTLQRIGTYTEDWHEGRIDARHAIGTLRRIGTWTEGLTWAPTWL